MMERLYHGKDDLSMATGRYLAMRWAEFAEENRIPEKYAWMVCPFSPEWRTPPALPPGSLLILTDEKPPAEMDQEQICQTVQAMDCAGVVLDFQKPKTKQTAAFATRLVSALPCPVAVSEGYAAELDCPVFLSPCPHHVPLQEHLAPWQGRELWLDLARDAETITLTKDGCSILPLPLGEIPEGGFADERLRCHYRAETGDDFARFTLWRTTEDVDALMEEAETLGIQTFVGLWQELG